MVKKNRRLIYRVVRRRVVLLDLLSFGVIQRLPWLQVHRHLSDFACESALLACLIVLGDWGAVIDADVGAFICGKDTALGFVDTSLRSLLAIDISGGLVEPWSNRATSSFPHTRILHGEADTIMPVSHARNLDNLLKRHEVRHQTILFPNEDTGSPRPRTSASLPSLLVVTGEL